MRGIWTPVCGQMQWKAVRTSIANVANCLRNLRGFKYQNFKKKSSTALRTILLFLVEMRGIWTPRLRCCSAFSVGFLSQTLAKRKAFCGGSISISHKKGSRHKSTSILFGGDEGNRTPVRKPLDMTFSVGSLLFRIPPQRREQTRSASG